MINIKLDKWVLFHTGVCKTLDAYMCGGCRMVQLHEGPPFGAIVQRQRQRTQNASSFGSNPNSATNFIWLRGATGSRVSLRTILLRVRVPPKLPIYVWVIGETGGNAMVLKTITGYPDPHCRFESDITHH